MNKLNGMYSPTNEIVGFIPQINKIEIYFKDLNEITQKKILKLYGYKEEKDGNFEILPLFILIKD